MIYLTEEERKMSVEELVEKIAVLQNLIQDKEGIDSQNLLNDLNYLFRRGMALRKYHVEEIFGTTSLAEQFPDLITISGSYLYTGTDKLRAQMTGVDYKPQLLNIGAEDIRTMILGGEKLATKTINALPPGPMDIPQYVHGLKSGILKHDIRGYYVDPKVDIEDL